MNDPNLTVERQDYREKRLDSTSAEYFREAAGAHGTVIMNAEDLQRRAILALSGVKAALEVEGGEVTP